MPSRKNENRRISARYAEIRRFETVEFRLTTATTATAFAKLADLILDLQLLSLEIVK
jgi:hypothetical protein